MWVNSRKSNWFEAAHPWKVSNNQGVEGKNKEIKQSHTFRRRLDIGELFSVMINIVKKSGLRKMTSYMCLPSPDALNGEVNSLSFKTDGYQWYKMNKNKSDRIIRINPKDKYSLNGSFNNFWAVATSSNKSDKAKERMMNREMPDSTSFDDFVIMRSSCWILEECDGEFFCDCPVGIKVN